MTISRRTFLAASMALAAWPAWKGASAAAPPATPRQWLDRWLSAFNRSERAYASFVRAHVPTAATFLDDDLALREATGGFALLRSEATAPGEITGWLRDRQWDRFSRVVLKVGDGRIDDLSFAGAPPPPEFAVQRLDEHEALARLRRKLRNEAAAGRFSGAVLVARGDTAVMREVYGARDVDGKRKMAPDTRFCLGSMGKMFTAVSVLQLVQQGRLRLTDTIAGALPAYPDTPLARQATVEHLLTHSGGTGDFFGDEYEAHKAELRAPMDFVRRFGRREPAFPPGSRWGYSNFGFIVLGAIVEQASGIPWDEYQKIHVFRPAGMTSTSPAASADDTARPLTGATRTGLKALPFYAGLPAGGGYSTLDDMHRFGVALRSGHLLDATHLDLLTRPRIDAGSRRWSLGLSVGSRNGVSYYGHGGSAPGVNADFATYPDLGYETVVLSNRGHPHAANVAEFIGARLPLRGLR